MFPAGGPSLSSNETGFYVPQNLTPLEDTQHIFIPQMPSISEQPQQLVFTDNVLWTGHRALRFLVPFPPALRQRLSFQSYRQGSRHSERSESLTVAGGKAEVNE